MSATGLSAFDSTMHTTNVWLQDLMNELDWHDRQHAYHALRVVLHALRDHLSVEEVAALGAQLPMLIRGFYYEGWRPSATPVRERKKAAFLAHIESAFRDYPHFEVEEITRHVFRVLARHVSPGEIHGVKSVLPAELRSLWD